MNTKKQSIGELLERCKIYFRTEGAIKKNRLFEDDR